MPRDVLRWDLSCGCNLPPLRTRSLRLRLFVASVSTQGGSEVRARDEACSHRVCLTPRDRTKSRQGNRLTLLVNDVTDVLGKGTP